MSMEKKKDFDISNAIPKTPEMCKNAVLYAVSTYREEKQMKKPYRILIAAAIMAALLFTTAFAIVSYYSVRDYVGKGNTSSEFEKRIVDLNQTATIEGISLTLGDAVFDGQALAFTMNIFAEENAKPLYFYPTLTAWKSDKKLNVEYMGFDMGMDRGIFIPSTDKNCPLSPYCGVEASLWEPITDGKITWRYEFQVFTPTKPIVNARHYSEGDTMETYALYLRSIYEDGGIGVVMGTGIGDFLRAIEPEGYEGTFYEHIFESGMFTLTDTVVFEFETKAPERLSLKNEGVFDFDGYTVNVKSITETFLKISYELEVVYDEKQENEHNLEQFYMLIDQDGNSLGNGDITISLSEDMKTLTVKGNTERISDEALKELTFKIDPQMTIDPNDTEEEMPEFTVVFDR